MFTTIWRENYETNIESKEDMTEQEAKQFVNLVENMRKAQKEYFRGRTGRDLDRAKKLESEVDKIIKREREEQLEALQGKLF